MLSVLLWYTDSDYPIGIFWYLCCLFFFNILILTTPLVSFGHCVVCSSLICSDYPFGIFWSLCCLFHLWYTDSDYQTLVSFGHCVVCSSLIYWFWLPLWYLLVIVLSVLLWYTDSDYPFGIFWSLCCLFFCWYTESDYFGIFWSFVECSSLIYWFWLPLWYLLVIVLFVLLWYTDSDYHFGIFWSLCCLFFFDILILTTTLVSFGHCVVCSSLIYWFWLPLWYLLVIVLSVLLWSAFWLPLWYLWSLCWLFFFDMSWFWLPLWYLLVIVLSVLLWYTDSDYPFGIFWPLCCLFFFDILILTTPLVSFWSLCCLFFFDILILTTPLVSFGHCVVCSSLIYWFWLPLWYLLVIVLFVLLQYTDSDYHFGIFSEDLPYLYWIPKLHKTPYKERYIAGSSTCSTKELSIHLTKILSTVKEGQQKYCETVYSRSGINHMWILKNSKDLLDNLKSRSFSQVSSIKTFDFSTLYTTLPHDKLKTRLKETIHKAFSHRNYGSKFVVLGYNSTYFSNKIHKGKTCYSEEQVISMLEFLIDNIFVSFGGTLFQQVVGIPMGTNCAPLLADLFLYSYESEFLQKLVKDKKIHEARAFNFTYRYIDDVLSINNSRFAEFLPLIYPPELEVKETTDTASSASFLDLYLEFDDSGQLSTKIYDKRDDFNFKIINFPNMCSNIPASPAYGVYISQLIRYARASSNYSDFLKRHLHLRNRLLDQGYKKIRLIRSLKKFIFRYQYLVEIYSVSAEKIISDAFSYSENV